MLEAPVVSPESLVDVIGVRYLDARSAAAYAESHLTGAVHAGLESHLSAVGHDAARGGRHPLPEASAFAAQLGRWGIAVDTPVVVYDDKGGANAAARAWWMLRALGHEPVAVLDGGLSAAIDAGLPTTTEVPTDLEREPYPASAWLLPIADIDEVALRATDPEWLVLDVRSGERFRGESEPIDPIAGHIPGAVHRFFGDNLGEDGRFRSADELADSYRQLLGGRSVDRLIVHCGSGVTACHTLVALDRAGLSGARLYVGSWSEWCRNDRPREP